MVKWNWTRGMKIAFNGKWLCARIDFFFPLFWPTFLFSVPVLGKLYVLHHFSVFSSWEFSSYDYRSHLSSLFMAHPACPALGPLPSLTEEALGCLAMVHLSVTASLWAQPLSGMSLCLNFDQPSWSSLFSLPSAGFSTCHFLPVVVSSCSLGRSFPSQYL